MEGKTNKSGLRGKLFEIQKAIKTFAVSEKSAKTDPKTGKETYLYTPTWKIVEALRKEMDDRCIMLDASYELVSANPVEHPVYVAVGNNPTPMRFNKKDMHVILRGTYTWVDVETGETVGPITNIADSANGIDKSTSGAMTLSERYFLLKYFHITTRETADEPDANDADTVPGIPPSGQRKVGVAEAVQAQEAGGAPAMPQAVPAGTYVHGPAPQQDWKAPRGQTAPAQNAFGAPQQYVQQPRPAYQPGTGPLVDESNPAVRDAVNALSFFDRGTDSHRERMNQVIGTLAASGIPCTDERFINALAETAQARREGRAPRYDY